jgi:hypothetical protein
MAKKQNRDQRLRLYYTREEYQRVKVLMAQSNHRTMSGYVRQISLGKPVVVAVRNRSFDLFIDEIIILRKELAAIMRGVALTTEQKERIIAIQEEVRILINKIAQLCTPR